MFENSHPAIAGLAATLQDMVTDHAKPTELRYKAFLMLNEQVQALPDLEVGTDREVVAYNKARRELKVQASEYHNTLLDFHENNGNQWATPTTLDQIEFDFQSMLLTEGHWALRVLAGGPTQVEYDSIVTLVDRIFGYLPQNGEYTRWLALCHEINALGTRAESLILQNGNTFFPAVKVPDCLPAPWREWLGLPSPS